MTDSEIIAKDLSSTSAIESQQLQIVPGGISLLDKARKKFKVAKSGQASDEVEFFVKASIRMHTRLTVCLTSHIDTNTHTYIYNNIIYITIYIVILNK